RGRGAVAARGRRHPGLPRIDGADPPLQRPQVPARRAAAALSGVRGELRLGRRAAGRRRLPGKRLGARAEHLGDPSDPPREGAAVSCPDWRRLDPAARDAAGAPRAAADATGAISASGAIGAVGAIDALHALHWQQALSHLDSGCPDCWREALAVDPTLIFRRLPAAELTAAQEADEVEAARLAGAAMRPPRRLA